MPKPKWNLNTIYISERLQESLRPISRCAMTTVVAPMGYGKTTAVNWYLAERAGAEVVKIVRINVYSDNLAIFWRSVQDAFAQVTALVAVTKLKGLVLARRRSARNGSAAECARYGTNFDLDGRIASRVEDFPCVNLYNLHSCNNLNFMVFEC